jgi:hypothetical protein
MLKRHTELERRFPSVRNVALQLERDLPSWITKSRCVSSKREAS